MYFVTRLASLVGLSASFLYSDMTFPHTFYLLCSSSPDSFLHLSLYQSVRATLLVDLAFIMLILNFKAAIINIYKLNHCDSVLTTKVTCG